MYMQNSQERSFYQSNSFSRKSKGQVSSVLNALPGSSPQTFGTSTIAMQRSEAKPVSKRTSLLNESDSEPQKQYLNKVSHLHESKRITAPFSISPPLQHRVIQNSLHEGNIRTTVALNSKYTYQAGYPVNTFPLRGGKQIHMQTNPMQLPSSTPHEYYGVGALLGQARNPHHPPMFQKF